MTEPELVVVEDAEALATEASGRIATTLADAVATRGRADWATTGGSTVPAIYRRLAAASLRDTVPWPSVHVWWGDDRFVPHDDPLSNVKPLEEILLASGARDSVPLPSANRHPFPTDEAIDGGRGADWCAAQLAARLGQAGLDEAHGWPVFDLVVVGIGGDGHLLSVFPESAAFDSKALALAVPAPTHIEPHVERVTLNPAILGVARRLLVVASGTAKAAVLGEIFGPDRDPRRWPAQLARRPRATWIVDAAAAANLRHSG